MRRRELDGVGRPTRRAAFWVRRIGSARPSSWAGHSWTAASERSGAVALPARRAGYGARLAVRAGPRHPASRWRARAGLLPTTARRGSRLHGRPVRRKALARRARELDDEGGRLAGQGLDSRPSPAGPRRSPARSRAEARAAVPGVPRCPSGRRARTRAPGAPGDARAAVHDGRAPAPPWPRRARTRGSRPSGAPRSRQVREGALELRGVRRTSGSSRHQRERLRRRSSTAPRMTSSIAHGSGRGSAAPARDERSNRSSVQARRRSSSTTTAASTARPRPAPAP